jgi:hypothetical protein
MWALCDLVVVDAGRLCGSDVVTAVALVDRLQPLNMKKEKHASTKTVDGH